MFHHLLFSKARLRSRLLLLPPRSASGSPLQVANLPLDISQAEAAEMLRRGLTVVMHKGLGYMALPSLPPHLPSLGLRNEAALADAQRMGEAVIMAKARVGELLKEIPPKYDLGSPGRTQTLPVGINKRASHQAQTIAKA